MISIIIPAHNEENVISRCLSPLLSSAKSKEFEVIVVCNGCDDATAQIVTSFEKYNVKLIETSVPSKANALNLGDKAASGFPRFYLDADVVISIESIRQVARVLSCSKILAAAPQMRVNCSYASWSVRSYYDVWQQLPYVQEGMIGTGVYALSQEGRSRFEKFPDIIADDGYVRALFVNYERVCVEKAVSEVYSPATLKDLLKILKRVRLGNYELFSKFPQLKKNEEKDYIYAVKKVVKNIRIWFKIPVYLYVVLITRMMAKKHLKKYGLTGWERDESSRAINKYEKI